MFCSHLGRRNGETQMKIEFKTLIVGLMVTTLTACATTHPEGEVEQIVVTATRTFSPDPVATYWHIIRVQSGPQFSDNGCPPPNKLVTYSENYESTSGGTWCVSEDQILQIMDEFAIARYSDVTDIVIEWAHRHNPVLTDLVAKAVECSRDARSKSHSRPYC